MITVEPITDLQVLYGALQEEEIYKDILTIDTLDGWVPNLISSRWYLGAEDGVYKGLIICQIETENVWAWHGGVYSPYRDESSRLVKAAMELIKAQNNVKLMTMFSSKKEKVLRLMKAFDWDFVGRIPNGYKDGDMLIYAEKE
jgi:hypothetical protein